MVVLNLSNTSVVKERVLASIADTFFRAVFGQFVRDMPEGTAEKIRAEFVSYFILRFDCFGDDVLHRLESEFIHVASILGDFVKSRLSTQMPKILSDPRERALFFVALIDAFSHTLEEHSDDVRVVFSEILQALGFKF